MLSNRDIKWINSLKNRKYRLKHKAYIAEGPRLINELILNGQTPLKIFRTVDVHVEREYDERVMSTISLHELKKISTLVQPNGVLAVFELPDTKVSDIEQAHPKGEWGFALDFLQDPGNLGTIIRTLAWLGIEHLYCSHDSVDVFNPKVIQASMGGIGRLLPRYVDLADYLRKQEVPIYAADMNGDTIGAVVPEPGIIVLGNEGQGLSDEIRKICVKAISIPRLGSGESLNVGVSAAILAAWVRIR